MLTFKLRTTGYFYDNYSSHIEMLKSLGFEFDPPKEEGLHGWSATRYTKKDIEPEIEIETLDDLLALRERVRTDIILCENNVLEIYDDYRE